MKSILYFVLACLTVVYIGFLCYVNIVGSTAMWMTYISVYGGLAIALAYAVINFFGNPLKMVFFILLIIAVVVLILTIAIPDVFRKLFNIAHDGSSFIKYFKF